MYFHEESESGKAVRMVDSPRVAGVTRFEWIPRSVIVRISKFPKGDGHDYAEWEMELPEWIAEQKNLGAFEK